MRSYGRWLLGLLVALMALAIPETVEAKAQLVDALRYRWTLHARPEQIEPAGDWSIWFVKTGRGWGKTRTAAELVRHWVETGRFRRLHLVARTAADARDTMVKGVSGILAISPPWFMPIYQPSTRSLVWPNGAQALLFSAEEPDALRGPACDAWWADEMASWKYLEDTWDNLQFGAREGHDVRGIITSTPRPLKFLKELVKRGDVITTSGHTLENRANLAGSFLAQISDKYEGTIKGRQELGGEIMDDDPRALWKRADIEADRVRVAPELVRIVVAVDPSITEDGDEAGIVCAGKGMDGQYYLLDDLSCQASPDAWARKAVNLFRERKADRLVYETNQGGQMVTLTIQTVDRSIPLRAVHASRGKLVRAEPIAALSEQHRVHHVGSFPELEDELCNYIGEGESPNRLDAYVYALTELHMRAPGKIVGR